MTYVSRKSFLATGGAIVGAAAVPGIGRSASLVPFDITVTHYPDQDYALPVLIAQELGYMAKEGIDVKPIVGSSGGGTTVRNISSGGLILGEVATSAGIKAIMAGENLKIVGGGVQTPGTICWAVKKDSPIKSIGDLQGKTVGFTQPGSVSESLLVMSLKAAGIDPSSVKTRAAGGIGENFTLLTTGGLDCAFMVDPTFSQQTAAVRAVFFARDYIPQYLQTVWLAGDETMKTKGALIAGFLRARARGVEYVVGHPVQAASRWAKAALTPQEAIAVTLSHEKPSQYFGKGSLSAASLSRVVEGMRIGKLLGANDKVQLAKIVDQRALPAIQRVNLPAEV